MPRTLTFAGVKSLGFTSGSPPSWTKPGADTTLAEIQHSTPYSDSVKAVDNSANPYNVSYDIVDGFFPIGILFDPVTGQVSGTTTTAGPWSVTIRAQNEFGGVLRTFTGTVADPPLPPTFVSQNFSSGNSSIVSLSMPARQSGDIAIITFSSWRSFIPPFSSSGVTFAQTNTNADNWILVANAYFSGSVYDEQGGTVYRADWGLHQTHYRVMTNTSTDNFSYTLPQQQSWLIQVLIVRGQAGHSFQALGGNVGGQTGTWYSTPFYHRMAILNQNNRPKSIVGTYHIRGMSASGTLAAYVHNSETTGAPTLNGGSPITISTSGNTSSNITAYSAGVQNTSAKYVSTGAYGSISQDEVWLMTSYGVLEWYRT